jgi:exosortase C (VPDSG-CTERM-specific)
MSWRLPAGWAVLCLLYARPLWDLASLARSNELHSHLVLIPFICGYLAYTNRERLPAVPSRPAWGWGIGLVFLGLLSLGLYLSRSRHGGAMPPEDVLWPGILSLVCIVLAWLAVAGGRDLLRAMAFPAAFLFFMVPMSTGLAAQIEIWLQHVSADAAYWMIDLTGTPIYRDGQVFQMPGLVVEVAQECSGIRSSLVLLIGAVLAAYLLLDRPWKRVLLVLLVIPLGILRNGFRILTITWLTVNVDPRVIESPLHHRGGPIFFVLSLVVLLGLVILLRAVGKRGEGREKRTVNSEQ